MWSYETERDDIPYLHRGDNGCQPHIHKSVEMLFTEQGEKRVFAGDRDYTLVKNDMLLCPPYCVHRYYASENSTQTVLVVPAEICESFVALCEKARPETLVLKGDEKLAALFKEILNSKNEILFAGIACHIMGIFADRVPFVSGKNAENGSFLKSVAEYIDKRYDEETTLGKISREFGYSPNHFSALFKKNFSMTFTSYLNEVRIKKSLKNLGKHKTASVIAECGFNSPQQYYLNFRKVFGCTPTEYISNIDGQK